MRVLIISALLAYASSAPSVPSGVVVSALTNIAPAIPLSPLIPTISPGDVEAAAINAKVAADDATQQAEDQTRLSSELANENITGRQIVLTDLTKENSVEAFWASEEKKWQAIDTAKTLEAKFNGEIASNADNLAKAAITGQYVAAVPAIAAPYLAAYYAPESQSISTQSLSQTHPIPEVKPIVAEPILKTATSTESIKEAEPIKEDIAFPLRASSELENVKLEKAYVAQPLLQSSAFLTPIAFAPGFKYADPWIVPQVAFFQPQLKSIATSSITQTHGQGILSPAAAIVKTGW